MPMPAESPGSGDAARIVFPGLKRPIAAKTQGQKDYLQAIEAHDIVVSIGPAGTGKTYLAVAKAVEALARKRVRRIILAVIIAAVAIDAHAARLEDHDAERDRDGA